MKTLPRPATQAQRVLELVATKGLLRAAEAAKLGIAPVVLARMSRSGQLEKVARGLYRLPAAFSERESLAVVSARAPQAVLCLLSALQLHELTTQLPRQVWIAMPRGSHCPRGAYPPIKMVQFSAESYSTGIELVESGYNTLRVYDPAKTVVDCFKHRSKVGLDVALEALKAARNQNKASLDQLWRYAVVCRVAKLMQPYLEAIG